jgi:hypothetical protein
MTVSTIDQFIISYASSYELPDNNTTTIYPKCWRKLTHLLHKESH